MTSSGQLETYADELAAAVKILTDYCRNAEVSVDFAAGNAPQPLVPPDAPSEAHKARRAIIANVAKLRILLSEPVDFLQQLAVQVCHSFPSMLPETDAELTRILTE